MIEQLRHVLDAMGYELGGPELLDVLWLARAMNSGAPADAASSPTTPPRHAGARPKAPSADMPPPATSPADPLSRERRAQGPSTPAEDADHRHRLFTAYGTQSSAGGIGARPIRAPAPRALPGMHGLAQALRPLRRHRDHRHRTVADIEATVRLTAESGVLDVIDRPEQELRHTAVLLVDDSASMRVWQPLVRDLRQLLERAGVFRAVDVHRFDLRGGRRPGTAPRTESPIVFVLTDGVDEAWRGTMAARILKAWKRSGPLVVLPPLPRRLWRGTAFAAQPYLLAAKRPFAPDGELGVFDPLDGGRVERSADTVPVPVVALSPTSLGTWARLLTHPGAPQLVDTVLVGTLGKTEAPSVTEGTTADPPSAGQLLERFRASFSPEAYRLAVRLSAIRPLSTPVIQLVRIATHPTTSSGVVSEVLLGELLEPLDDREPTGRRVNAVVGGRSGDLLYDFKPGVRDLLASGLSTEQSIEVVESVGQALEPYLGRTPDFAALLADPEGSVRLSPETTAFAVLVSPVLDRLYGVPGTEARTRPGLVDVEVEIEDQDDDQAETVHEDAGTPLATAVILTALPFEYAAVRAHLTEIETRVHPRYGSRAEVGRLFGTRWRVALVETGETTNAVAVLTERTVSWFAPEAVLFVGVAGGLKEDVDTGDVVVATKAYTFRGRRTPKDFAVRPETWYAPGSLEQTARHALQGHSHVHFKPIAAGDVSTAESASALTRHVRQYFADAVAIEVEGTDVTSAAYLAGNAGALIIRGISDNADAGKRGAGIADSQQLAASQAAAAAVTVLRELTPGAIPAIRPDAPHTHGPVPVVAGLPSRPHGFMGRSDELGRLLPHLEPAPNGTDGLPVLIFAVTGMGGIGKTALAIEAAHQACSQGWFPGGALFVDLRGYDDNPVTADQAVLALLDALGVRGPDLPPSTARQYDTYRQLLAERQDRMLLILDNASDPAQYLPLLPGTDRHRVLITSRDRPDALPVRLIDLETLPPDDSAALITRALHDADERDDRPGLEPNALRELTSLCGQLPLALQIAAAMLRRRRHRPIASLVEEFRQAGDATASLLDSGVRGVDQYGRSLSLRPVLETSYRRLPPDQARLLRLLSLAPGADTSTEAVTALADLDMDTALSLLEDLAGASLVTPVSPGATGMRWRLHDLVRAFGVGVVAGDAELVEEGEAARGRVLEFYCRWADAADDRLRWLPGMAEPERFADRGQALEWLDGERAGLVAAVQWAGEERYADAAVRLASCLAVYLEWRRYFDDWIAVSLTARDAARLAGDHGAEARAWSDLGKALHEAGRVEEAVDALTRARELHQAVGDRHSEGVAWSYLGGALHELGRVTEAVDALTRARQLHQTVGDHHSEGIAWNNLGNALRTAGRVEEAVDALTRARELHQTVGDHHSEGIAWNNLGNALRTAGRAGEAIEAFGKSLEIMREFEDWYGAGQTLENLGIAHESVGNVAQARTSYRQAADAYSRADASTEAAQSSADAERLA
jgi:nucleoside phosphorylase/tetratricopeptide (TPR) repeat protein